MHPKKLLGIGILAFLFCMSAEAKVMVLNNQSLSACRAQLSSVRQSTILVAAYEPGCEWWEKYQSVFFSLANSGTPAAFFQYNFEDAAQGVTEGCLGAEIPGCPTTLMYSKNKRQYQLVGNKTGYQTQQELSSFIMGQ